MLEATNYVWDYDEGIYEHEEEAAGAPDSGETDEDVPPKEGSYTFSALDSRK